MIVFEGYWREFTLQALILLVGFIICWVGFLLLTVHGVSLVIRGQPAEWDHKGPILAGVLIAVCVASIIYIFYARSDWAKHHATAQGVITRSAIQAVESQMEGTDRTVKTLVDYVINLEYSFRTPDEKERIGRVMAEDKVTEEPEVQKKLLTKYAVGTPFTVYYDSRNPELNTIKEYPMNARLRSAVGFLIFGLLFGGYIFGFYKWVAYMASLPKPEL